MPRDVEVIVNQSRALTRIDELVGDQLWSPRQRREWTTMLRAMVFAADWDHQPHRAERPRDPGLIKGITRDGLGQLVGRSPTTVSRLWAWAESVGLLCRVEQGAPKSWLGTEHNRAAIFAFTAPRNDQGASPSADGIHKSGDEFSQLSGPVDNNGNHPVSDVGRKPLNGSSSHTSMPRRWTRWRIPETPSERALATAALLTTIGLNDRSVSKKRVHGLLLSWWRSGWCLAGLLYAIDHHPDSHASLGDAVRGARDPLATIGARLTRWSGRRNELPDHLHGIRGDYLKDQATRLASRIRPITDTRQARGPISSVEARAAARNAVRRHLAELADQRRQVPRGSSPRCAPTRYQPPLG